MSKVKSCSHSLLCLSLVSELDLKAETSTHYYLVGRAHRKQPCLSACLSPFSDLHVEAPISNSTCHYNPALAFNSIRGIKRKEKNEILSGPFLCTQFSFILLLRLEFNYPFNLISHAFIRPFTYFFLFFFSQGSNQCPPEAL